MNIDLIRAWKDARYRQSLSEAELALVPEHPAGVIELHASELERVFGAADAEVFTEFCTDFPPCPTNTVVG